MKVIIPEPQTEPLRPLRLTPTELNSLKRIGASMDTRLSSDKAKKLFKQWLDDRILFHSAVKKMLFYNIVGSLIKHRPIEIASEKMDARVPIIVYITSGGGKMIIGSTVMTFRDNMVALIREALGSEANSIIAKRFKFMPCTKITSEALLGTVRPAKDEEGWDGWVANFGALGENSLTIINEGSPFFRSKDTSNMENFFPYVCQALDPIGSNSNQISKKLTGKPTLWYETDTNFLIFVQPEHCQLSEEIITTGTLPRFVNIYSPVSEEYHELVLHWRLNRKRRSSAHDMEKMVRYFLKIFSNDNPFSITQKAKDILFNHMKDMVKAGKDNRLIQLYVKTAYQRTANMIMKMAACNCAFRLDDKINKEDMLEAIEDFQAVFITTVGMFTDFIANVRYTHSKIHEVLPVIQQLWLEHEDRVETKIVRDKLRELKHFNITDRAMNTIFSVMDNGKFIIWDRGVGRKKSYIVNPEEEKELMKRLIV